MIRSTVPRELARGGIDPYCELIDRQRDVWVNAAARLIGIDQRAVNDFNDAADVPITYTFGPNTLVSFKVWTDQID